MLTFAIGDIHGCRDLLADLLSQAARRARGEPYRIVCIGDVIDRGPDSAGVVALLMEREAQVGPDRLICLRGNHEDMLLRALREPGALSHWLRNGGGETLASYGVEQPADMPPAVLSWMGRMPTSFDDGRRHYVHAGLDPALPIAQQGDEDRLWIREPFLSADHDFGRFIVHGHTPLRGARPDLRRGRVNLDTAAVYGGPLTAAVFTDDRDPPSGFLQASRGAPA